MKDSIRFLVLWVGTKCTLRCKNCCNLIPYAKPISYNVQNIMDNLAYVTKDVAVELLQIQGGEPFTHSQLDEIIVSCALNQNIKKVEIASNGTVFPNDRTLKILKEYEDKVVLRLSKYTCVESRQRDVDMYLQKQGVKAVHYDFMFGNGLWFDSGDISQNYNGNQMEVKEIYRKCANRSCWVLANDYMAVCGKVINLLEIKGGKPDENNIINVSACRESNLSFREVLQRFDRKYIEEVPALCGYCKIQNEYIEPAIQISHS